MPSVNKLTNALVEIGLILASVVLGVLGQPLWMIAVMVVIGSVWWGVVHHERLGVIMSSGIWGGLGTVAIALAALTLGHGIGYGLGLIFHTILGLK